MNNPKASRLSAVLNVFHKQKVLTMSERVTLLQGSERTIQRRLKEWRAYSSYNHNGRYYTLPTIAPFDHDGLWKWGPAFFSEHGTVKETIRALVEFSTAGLSALEIREIMGISVHNLLSTFTDNRILRRVQQGGLYIYFSPQQERFERQQTAREKRLRAGADVDLLSDEEAIIILVEWIKHADDSVEQLARRVRRRGVKSATTKVHHLLCYHDLIKKILALRY